MPYSSKYINKDLSWLSFNYRVLMEAKDPSNPLYERIKFLAIYASNLDEFFKVKIAGLKKLANETKNDPDEQDENYKKVFTCIREKINTYHSELSSLLFDELLLQLRKNNIHLMEYDNIHEDSRGELLSYYKCRILTFLHRQFLTPGKEHQIEISDNPYLFLSLEREGVKYFSILNIPSDKLPRFYQLHASEAIQFIFLDDIIKMNLADLYEDFEILEVTSFRLLKDESISIDDEFSGNLVQKIKGKLSKDKNATPVNFEFDEAMSKESLRFLKKFFKLKNKDLMPGSAYQNVKDFIQLPNPLKPKLEVEKFEAQPYQPFDDSNSIFKAIEKKDHIIHFPYHSFDYVLRFINEAAVDTHASEIRITLYRVAEHSIIANALITAAKNGKKVIVFVEVKARDDEANNLYWAEQMELVGITIVYSIPALKVHAKMALVKYEEPHKSRCFAYLSTGNFNESTAKIYSDFGYFISRKKLTGDLLKLFDFIHKKESLAAINELLVTKYNLTKKFMKQIDNEIINKKLNKKASIIVKVNNLEEKELIDKLYEAADAGVELTLIVRSICSFRLKRSYSKNVKIIRLVDTYLEHARVVYFYDDGRQSLYLSSADWMKRNLHHRIEVAFPVKKSYLKEFIISVLQLQINDTVKAVELGHEMENILRKPGNSRVRAQHDTFRLIKELTLN